MFGFFKGVAYRTKCTTVILNILPRVEAQQCTEYVEDFKALFDKPREANLEPAAAVSFVCNLVLLAMVDGKEDSLKSFDNCHLTMPITLAVVQATLDLNTDEEVKKDLKKALKTIDDRNKKVINQIKDNI